MKLRFKIVSMVVVYSYLLLVLILLILLSLPRSVSAAVGGGCGSLPNHAPFVAVRGGGDSEQQQQLDAFIEELLLNDTEDTSSFLDNNDPDRSVSLLEEASIHNNSNKNSNRKDETVQQDDSAIKSISKEERQHPIEDQKEQQTVTSPSSSPPHTKAVSECSTQLDHPNRDEKPQAVLVVDDNVATESILDATANQPPRNDDALHSTNDEPPLQQQQQQQPSSQSTTTATRRPPPPPIIHPFYRFLLSQGRFGRIVAMILVLLLEWLQTFLPQCAALMATLFPPHSFPQQRHKQKTRQQAQKSLEKQTRARDQSALELLLQSKNNNTRYQWCSVPFLQVHRLGAYRIHEQKKNDPFLVDDGARGHSLGSVRNTNRNKQQQQAQDETEEEEEEDVAWVAHALTKQTPAAQQRRKQRRPSIVPSLSVGVSSRHGPSISVGIELDTTKTKRKRRTSLSSRNDAVQTALISEQRRRKQRPSGPRKSDRDGGLFGRLRTGTDSMLSRSLLGAYPGDAVPKAQAANPQGIPELARKYGWGEWSEEDRSDTVSATRKKVRRRKKRQRNE